MAKLEDGRFRVVDADNHRRVHFEGEEADARAFMVAQAPRPHVEEGNIVPSVVLVPGNEYHAGNGEFRVVEED